MAIGIIVRKLVALRTGWTLQATATLLDNWSGRLVRNLPLHRAVISLVDHRLRQRHDCLVLVLRLLRVVSKVGQLIVVVIRWRRDAALPARRGFLLLHLLDQLLVRLRPTTPLSVIEHHASALPAIFQQLGLRVLRLPPLHESIRVISCGGHCGVPLLSHSI